MSGTAASAAASAEERNTTASPAGRLATGRWVNKTLHRPRGRIEFFFNEFKQFRRIATHYGRAARNYLVSAKQHEVWRWI